MNILQVNNHEQIGGGSERVFQLTTKMLMAKGHRLATLSCGTTPFDDAKVSVLLPQNGYVESSPLKTARNIANFIYRPEAARKLENLVLDFRPAIAHLRIFYGQLSSSILAILRKHNIPIVMTVHEYRMLCPVSTLYTQSQGVCERCASGATHNAVSLRCNRGSLPASLLSATESWIRDRFFNYAEYIDHFFMVSEFCRNKHIQYLPGIRANSSILYNFIRDQDISESPAEMMPDAPYLYAGRLSHEKGIQLLCEAFRERPGLNLRIAGSGPLAEELRLGYADCANIKFLGKLDSEVLKHEMRNAKFSVVPSEWYENNPMSILESFGVGTPVLGASIGGIPELVLPGLTGQTFLPSNKVSLLEALDETAKLSGDARNAMGREAILLVRQRHSEAAYYDQLLSGYESVIRQRQTLN